MFLAPGIQAKAQQNLGDPTQCKFFSSELSSEAYDYRCLNTLPRGRYVPDPAVPIVVRGIFHTFHEKLITSVGDFDVKWKNLQQVVVIVIIVPEEPIVIIKRLADVLIQGAIKIKVDWDVRFRVRHDLAKQAVGADKLRIAFDGEKLVVNGERDEVKLKITGEGTLTEPCSGDSISGYPDGDGDGYGDASIPAVPFQGCALPAGFSSNNLDCDDTDPSVNPDAIEKICDGKDNNCDGIIDEGLTTSVYPDADGDGFGFSGVSATPVCVVPDGYVTNNDDCDDTNAAIYPGAPESCNGVDDDCDGLIDESVTTIFYKDADGDGYGDGSDTISACNPDTGHTATVSGDCDDTNAAIHPGAPELCNGVDDDCDGVADSGIPFAVSFLVSGIPATGANLGTVSTEDPLGLTIEVVQANPDSCQGGVNSDSVEPVSGYQVNFNYNRSLPAEITSSLPLEVVFGATPTSPSCGTPYQVNWGLNLSNGSTQNFSISWETGPCTPPPSSSPLGVGLIGTQPIGLSPSGTFVGLTWTNTSVDRVIYPSTSALLVSAGNEGECQLDSIPVALGPGESASTVGICYANVPFTGEILIEGDIPYYDGLQGSTEPPSPGLLRFGISATYQEGGGTF
jgi:hypothetical protein